ncbi:cryS, partial [Symbiodinium microadriaticum]
MFTLFTSAVFATAVTAKFTTVTLPDGTQLKGKSEGTTTTFKGIPFAQPPVGDLRWAPPQPWVNPDVSQVLDATDWGNVCVQKKEGGGNEDCLYLNVFVNMDMANSTSKLPVGIYVHGGSYTDGSGNLYPSANLVNYWKGNAIIVSTNYRLNVFGFLGSDELRQQDPESWSTGNYGLQDQRMAFDWVRRNIEAFGGDADHVMIYGESAGAGSMSGHLSMKKSWGLFTSVIMESGAFSDWSAQNMSFAETYYDQFKDIMDCDDLQCLLRKDATDVFAASESMKSLLPQVYGSPWAPVVDGVELTSHPWHALENGDICDVPILQGTNTDEGSLFTYMPKDATAAQLYKYWEWCGYSAEEISSLESLYLTQVYPTIEGTSRYWWAGERSAGDAVFSCPSVRTANLLSTQARRESDSFLYHFEHSKGENVLIPHTAELPFVFHNTLELDNEEDWLMADVMSSYWGNFLIDHDPMARAVGTSALAEWPSSTAPA